MKEFFKQLITARTGISSKRFCGVVGWITCIVVLLIGTIFGLSVPPMIETFMITCGALLGVDCISRMFKKE